MTIAIHSSLRNANIGGDLDFCYSHDIEPDYPIHHAFTDEGFEAGVPGKDYFYGGVIVGLVDVVASFDVSQFDDEDIDGIASLYASHGIPEPSNYAKWSIGPICWLVTKARRFRRGITAKGALNLWKLSPEVRKQVVKHSQDLLKFPAMPEVPIDEKPVMQLRRQA